MGAPLAKGPRGKPESRGLKRELPIMDALGNGSLLGAASLSSRHPVLGTLPMAELHVVGQIVGASGFPLPSIFCKYAVEAGSNFRMLQGTTAGQTQCDMPPVRAIPERKRACCALGV